MRFTRNTLASISQFRTADYSTQAMLLARGRSMLDRLSSSRRGSANKIGSPSVMLVLVDAPAG